MDSNNKSDLRLDSSVDETLNHILEYDIFTLATYLKLKVTKARLKAMAEATEDIGRTDPDENYMREQEAKKLYTTLETVSEHVRVLCSCIATKYLIPKVAARGTYNVLFDNNTKMTYINTSFEEVYEKATIHAEENFLWIVEIKIDTDHKIDLIKVQ